LFADGQKLTGFRDCLGIAPQLDELSEFLFKGVGLGRRIGLGESRGD
jgi:hypothetical protein